MKPARTDRIHVPRRRTGRRGAAVVEAAIVLPVLLLALFALLDLGLAAMQYNTLAEAARRIAREAVLHGSLASPAVGSWGPAQFSGTADDDDDVVQSVQGRLPTMPEELVNVQVTWPDNDNSPRDRVQVEISYVHEPLVPGLAVWGALNLRSVATMRIVN